MRVSRTPFAAVALLLALLVAWPVLAQAAARVLAPAGWWESSGAAPEAQRQASRWKDTLGLSLEQVVSARDDDRFAETIAVFGRPEPVPEQAFESEEAAIEALAATVVNLVGETPPEAGELRTLGTGERVVWARWTVDELAYECVLAPSGDSATLVIMVALARELGFQRERFDEVVATLEGVTAPMPRFSLLSWQIGAALLWVALALALHAAMLAFVDQDDDHTQAGTRASLITFGLVVLGTLGAYVFLGERELAIIHAGGSLNGLTMWISVSGMIVAGAHLMIVLRMDRGVVQSAPATGAFASGTYSSAEVLRSSISRTNLRTDQLEESSGWADTPSKRPPPAS